MIKIERNKDSELPIKIINGEYYDGELLIPNASHFLLFVAAILGTIYGNNDTMILYGCVEDLTKGTK